MVPASVVGLAFYGVGNHRFNNHIAKFKMMTGLRTMKKKCMLSEEDIYNGV